MYFCYRTDVMGQLKEMAYHWMHFGKQPLNGGGRK